MPNKPHIARWNGRWALYASRQQVRHDEMVQFPWGPLTSDESFETILLYAKLMVPLDRPLRLVKR